MVAKQFVFMISCVSILVVLGLAVSKVRQDRKRVPTDGKKLIQKLEGIHEPLGDPQPGDWLERHHEPGQTFAQYVRGRPVRPTSQRSVLYVIPLGQFSKKQQEVFDLTVEFLELYFGTPVKTLESDSLEDVPDSARRVHPSWGDKQILTGHILQKVLQPRLPDDGWALLALTSSDLWPGDGWNFVFGQASLRNRVGVWSIYRKGDPSGGEDEFRKCLERTLKTATHETGHMLSMQHCIYFECNMCGSNSMRESDRRPLYLCPICVAKLTWATDTDPVERAQKLQKYCEANGLENATRYYAKSLEILDDE